MTTAQQVIALVAKKTGRPESSVTPEKTFYQLGTDGDDAVDLVDELCRRYEVPTAGIDLRKYVGPESGGLLSRIIFVYSSPKTSYATQRELRIQDLIRTAEDRRWFHSD
ncbi:MAG: acyl carrier protein [Rhodospirillales bacterium]|nr:acyl carrier protein [Acetobacter sp.]